MPSSPVTACTDVDVHSKVRRCTVTSVLGEVTGAAEHILTLPVLNATCGGETVLKTCLTCEAGSLCPA